jgi:hypothetical protein
LTAHVDRDCADDLLSRDAALEALESLVREQVHGLEHVAPGIVVNHRPSLHGEFQRTELDAVPKSKDLDAPCELAVPPSFASPSRQGAMLCPASFENEVRVPMIGDAAVNQARAIVINCFYDELRLVLTGRGVPEAGIDSFVLALYARTKIDARKYSPPSEQR